MVPEPQTGQDTPPADTTLGTTGKHGRLENTLRPNGVTTKWTKGFESYLKWNRPATAERSNSAKGRTRLGELRSLRDLLKSPPAKHAWILEEVTRKFAETAKQQVNTHPAEDREDGRANNNRNAEATRSRLEELSDLTKDERDLGDGSRATDRTGHPPGRYDIRNHG